MIDDLKVNILIDNNCINLKSIAVNEAKSTAYINSCDIIVSMNIKTSHIIIYISIHAYKTIIMSLQFEVTISMHYITVSINRDFLFKSTN